MGHCHVNLSDFRCCGK